jgi:V8-like Glu-specific endopeptidase
MNDDETFYVDAAAFPGNSGSPVFLNPSSMTYDKTVSLQSQGDL